MGSQLETIETSVFPPQKFTPPTTFNISRQFVCREWGCLLIPCGVVKAYVVDCGSQSVPPTIEATWSIPWELNPPTQHTQITIKKTKQIQIHIHTYNQIPIPKHNTTNYKYIT